MENTWGGKIKLEDQYKINIFTYRTGTGTMHFSARLFFELPDLLVTFENILPSTQSKAGASKKGHQTAGDGAKKG